MGDVTVIELIKSVTEVGTTVVLLVAFVWHYLSKDKDSNKKVAEAYDDCQKQITAAYQDAQEKIEAANRTIREREDMLIESNAKREEMLRQESQKREEMIRRESEKRESILMLNMDKITQSMESYTKTLNQIKDGFTSMDRRLERMEKQLEGKMKADE